MKTRYDGSMKWRWIFISLVMLLGITHPVLAQSPSSQPSKEAFFSVMPQQQLILSEIHISSNVVNPDWIEIYNPTNRTLTLKNWSLKNEQNLEIGLNQIVIKPQQSQIVYLVKGFLTKAGGSVFVLDPSKQALPKMQVAYPILPRDVSWALVNDAWCYALPSLKQANDECHQPLAAHTQDRNALAQEIFHQKKDNAASFQYIVSDLVPVDASVAGLMDTNVVAVHRQTQLGMIVIICGLLILFAGFMPLLLSFHKGPTVEFPDHRTEALND